MDGFFSQMLTLLGYQVPELLAATAGVAMLWMWAPRAPGRTLAITGVAMILVAAVLRLLLSIGQAWMVHQSADAYVAMSGLLALFGALGMVFGLASSLGVALLAWGACKAMQAAAAARA